MSSLRQSPLSKLTDLSDPLLSLCFTCPTTDGVFYCFLLYCILNAVLLASISVWWVEMYFSMHSKAIASCMVKPYKLLAVLKVCLMVSYILVAYEPNFGAILKVTVTGSIDPVSPQIPAPETSFPFLNKEVACGTYLRNSLLIFWTF